MAYRYAAERPFSCQTTFNLMMITTRPTIQIPQTVIKVKALSLLRSRNNGSRSMVLVGQLLELVRVERVRARSLKDHSIWVIL